jgi:hypothetical protein
MKGKTVFTAILFLCLSVAALASWPDEGYLISSTCSYSEGPQNYIVPDTEGGFIIGYLDNSINKFILKRFNKHGESLWGDNTSFSDSGGWRTTITPVSNGYFMACRYSVDSSCEIQLFNLEGIPQWNNGKPIVIQGVFNPIQIRYYDNYPRVSIDTLGNCYLFALTTTMDYRVFKLSHDGQYVWDSAGILFPEERYVNGYPCYGLEAFPDDKGGVYLKYQLSTTLIFQHLKTDGSSALSSKGVILQTNAAYIEGLFLSRMAKDDQGYFYYTWANTSTENWMMQKIDSIGNPQWGPDGISITTNECNPSWYNGDSLCLSNDGCILFCNSDRDKTYTIYQVYIQKIDKDGNKLWGKDGIIMSYLYKHPSRDGGYIDYGYIKSIPDNEGGSYVAWTYFIENSYSYIYLGHLISDGQKDWSIALKKGSVIERMDLLSDDDNGIYCLMGGLPWLYHVDRFGVNTGMKEELWKELQD